MIEFYKSQDWIIDFDDCNSFYKEQQSQLLNIAS